MENKDELLKIKQMNDELFNIIYSTSNIETRYADIDKQNIIYCLQKRSEIYQEDLNKIILKFNDKNQINNNFEKFTILLNQIYKEVIKELVNSIKNDDEDEFYKNLKQNFLFLELTKRREVEEKVEKIKNRITEAQQKKTSLEKNQNLNRENSKFLDFYNNFLTNSFSETYQDVPEYKEEVLFINYLKELVAQQDQDQDKVQKNKNEGTNSKQNINKDNLIDIFMKDDECKKKFLK